MKKTFLGPFLLVIFGIIFLLNNLGILPWELWINLWKFWPVLLILFGAEFLLGLRTSNHILYLLLFLIFIIPIILVFIPLTGGSLSRGEIKFEKPLASLTKASIVYEISSNQLTIKSLPPSSILAIRMDVKYSQVTSKPTVNVETHFNQAKYTFSQGGEPSVPILSGLGGSGDLELSTLLPFDVSIKSGNGQNNLDFSSLRVDNLDFEGTAGSLDLKFSAHYPSKALIKTTTGIITITIPSGIEARITLDSTVKGVSIDSKRFPNNGNEYKTKGFDLADKRIDIEISTSAASLTVK